MRIRRALEREFGGWWFKVWGGPFQQAGIPDIIGCVNGMFFALEVKMPKGRVSEIQTHTIEAINIKGGGCAVVVRSPEEALRSVKDCLEQAGRLSTRSREVRSRHPDQRSVVRAGNREDVHRRRDPRGASKRRPGTLPSAVRRLVDEQRKHLDDVLSREPSAGARRHKR